MKINELRILTEMTHGDEQMMTDNIMDEQLIATIIK